MTFKHKHLIQKWLDLYLRLFAKYQAMVFLNKLWTTLVLVTARKLYMVARQSLHLFKISVNYKVRYIAKKRG